jgi:hypothetical protein
VLLLFGDRVISETEDARARQENVGEEGMITAQVVADGDSGTAPFVPSNRMNHLIHTLPAPLVDRQQQQRRKEVAPSLEIVINVVWSLAASIQQYSRERSQR